MIKEERIPLFLTMFPFSTTLNLRLPARVLPQDSLSLAALNNSTEGANWTHNSNWLAEPVSISG